MRPAPKEPQPKTCETLQSISSQDASSEEDTYKLHLLYKKAKVEVDELTAERTRGTKAALAAMISEQKSRDLNQEL